MEAKECTCGRVAIISYSLQRIRNDAEKLSERMEEGVYHDRKEVGNAIRQIRDSFEEIARAREGIKPKSERSTAYCTCDYVILIFDPLQKITEEVEKLFKAVQSGRHDPRSLVGDASLRMKGQLRQIAEMSEEVRPPRSP